MSERKKRLQVTNRQFFAICNELVNRQDEIQKTCQSKLAVAVFLKQRLGIDVSPHCIANALQTVGIKMECKAAIESNLARKHNTRILSTALLRLYRKLGEEPPQALVDMVGRLSVGAEPPPVTPDTNGKAEPIPLKSVPPPPPVVSRK